MCDYSIRHVAARPAKVGDKLVTASFDKPDNRGFAAVGEPDVAVCLLPGTELALEVPNGKKVLVARLLTGQHATVLQLPATPDASGHLETQVENAQERSLVT